jgi:L-arabinose isomerase
MKARIGLLGFYLELYDSWLPEYRAGMDRFYELVAQALEVKGLQVERREICRVAPEFTAAVTAFEEAKVDALVTLHLAYSPSLEAIDSLAGTSLPIVVLDTTPDLDFGPTQTADRITFNHGIHGVQDLCSLLVRRGKPFHIEAGHWQASDVLDRVVDRVRGIAAARYFRGARVGLIGDSFVGMGDFFVPEAELAKRYGITVRHWPGQASDITKAVTPERVLKEQARCMDFIKLDAVPQDILADNLRLGLILHDWMDKEDLSAFSFNFLSVKKNEVIDRVPFLYAALAMHDGKGYAGEGDVLTAALVGALLALNPATSFTEMFCPDWAGGRIFMSHMGEVNPRVCGGTAEAVHKDNKFMSTEATVYSRGRFMAGQALLVNLVPMEHAAWRLIVCPVIVEDGIGESFRNSVHGWVRPRLELADFLAAYSSAGGTHHSALVYGERPETLSTFGAALGFEVIVLG